MAKSTLRRNGPARDNHSAGVAEICKAAIEGDVDRVRSILEKKPELARRDGAQGYQAIHLAAREGHLEVVGMLLEAGASPGKLTYRERVSAIDLARHHGHAEVADAMAAWRSRHSGETESGSSFAGPPAEETSMQ